MNRVCQALPKCEAEADSGAASAIPQSPVGSRGGGAEFGAAVEPDLEIENATADPMAIRTLPFSPPRNGVAFPASSSEAAEQYRILRTKILQHPKKPRFVLV